ncbi:MAG: hypothetical protein JRJ77_10085 [Deltaproteobacteria bacterium]|nr:hypothetical protein [Deltaproteobacteria bacterium]MBW2339147.1 hypothetical protein [Deltaproteobacteria bacterium]
MAKLTLEYWEDDGWLVGRLVEVSGVFGQGETAASLFSLYISILAFYK